MHLLFKNIILLIAVPAISSAQMADFDHGSPGLTLPGRSAMIDTSGTEVIIPVMRDTPDGISLAIYTKNDSGDWELAKPTRITDKGNYYTLPPDTEVKNQYTCNNQNPNPYQKYWQVSVSYTNSPSNAGHSHAGPPPGLQNASGATLATPVTSPRMQIGSPFEFYWKVSAPAYATKVSWTARYSYACIGATSMIADMKVTNLVELPPGPGYTLDGAKPGVHPSNHFGTSAMNAALRQLAADYAATCPGAAALSYNDMSLPWGGLFDLNQNWKTPHEEHRSGNNIDVGKRQVLKADRKHLIEQMCRKFKVRSEGDGINEQPHYHLTMNGAKLTKDELAAGYDMDPKGISCCPLTDSNMASCTLLYSNGAIVYEPDQPATCQ